MDLGQISLRSPESGLLVGGTQVGKSTLSDELGRDFLERYRAKGGRQLILDTKPRYRGQFLGNGLPASKLYKRWDHGPVVPDSVVTLNVKEMLQAFRLGHQTVIAQAHSSRDLPAVLACCRAFLEDSRRGRPQLVRVDETIDFFHGNGVPRHNEDVIVRVARAGRERGTSALYCSQRTKGIPTELLEHMSKLYAFRLDAAGDAKRFGEFGCPIQPGELPERQGSFLYWTKQDRPKIWGPYMVDITSGQERAS